VEVVAEVAVRDVREKMNQGENQPEPEHWKQEEVKPGIEFRVIGESLRDFFGHDNLLA
jgi:hypothetical protein